MTYTEKEKQEMFSYLNKLFEEDQKIWGNSIIDAYAKSIDDKIMERNSLSMNDKTE